MTLSMHRVTVFFTVIVFAVLVFGMASDLDAQMTLFHHEDVFQPMHRLSGIGVDRSELSDLTLEKRTELMIDSQTFSIMRDPHALEGAARITSPKLQKIFKD